MLTELKPIITETTIALAKNHWYTFAVPVSENKYTLKKLIGEMFKVDVLDIKTMVVKGKTKRSVKTRKINKLPNWKKVLVRIKEEQKIDLFETGA